MMVVGLVFLVREGGWILWGGWRLLLDEVGVGAMLAGALVVVVVLGPVDGGIGFRGRLRDLGVRLLSVIHDLFRRYSRVLCLLAFVVFPSSLVLSSPQPRLSFSSSIVSLSYVL